MKASTTLDLLAVLAIAGVAGAMFTGGNLFGADEQPNDVATIGARASTIDAEVLAILKKEKLPAPPNRGGVVVTSPLPGGPAARAGLVSLDIIKRIGSMPIADGADYMAAIRSLTIGEPCKFYVLRLNAKKMPVRWEPKTLTIVPTSKREMAKRERESCPLKIDAVALRRNIIGVPEILVKLTNITSLDVVAVEVDAECWNRFGEKVVGLDGKNTFHGIGQTTIKSAGDATLSWQLSLHRTTTRAVIYVKRTKLANGVEWKADGDDDAPSKTAESSE